MERLPCPACPSLPIAAAVARSGRVLVAPERVPIDLLAVLGSVADPRARRGVRHRFVTILAIGVGAILAGAATYAAVAEWGHDLPLGVRVRLGLRRSTPSESTIRRTLQAVDVDALDRAVSAWLAARVPAVGAAADRPHAWPQVPTAGWRAVALDGKSVRGARGPDGHAVHLLAALDHDSGVVLGQTTVDGKTNELIGRCAAPGRAENSPRPVGSTPCDLGAGESVNELGAGASGRRPGVLPVST